MPKKILKETNKQSIDVFKIKLKNGQVLRKTEIVNTVAEIFSVSIRYLLPSKCNEKFKTILKHRYYCVQVSTSGVYKILNQGFDTL